jgi:arylsulfatase
VPLPGGVDGLTQWEVTLPKTLSAAGYATAHFGKWHLGSSQGRLPNDQGFDEWYGIPRTTDEAMFPSQAGAKAAGTEFMHIMEGRKGEKSRDVFLYDLDLLHAHGRVVADALHHSMARSRAGGAHEQ